MAGISLELRRMIRGNTAFSWAKGGSYALIVATGPWVLSMVAVAFIAKLLGGDGAEHATVFASISYSQAFSQLLFLPFLLAFSRHLADGLYLKNHRVIGEALVAAVFLCPLLATPVKFMPRVDESVVLLTMVNGGNVFAGACLGAFKRFRRIVFAYASGYAASCAAVFLTLAAGGDNLDCVRGFLLGQILLFALLLFAMRDALPEIRRADFTWLAKLWKNPAIPVAGLALAMGLWCEKIGYWYFAPDRVVTESGIAYCPSYDLPMFLAMISATPGIAFFYLQLETTFAEAMERFTERLSYGAPLAEIESAHEDVKAAVLRCLGMLFRVQAAIALFGLFFAEAVLADSGVGAVQTGVWRIVFLGVFFLVMFVCAQALLFYVNAVREAAICSVCLFATNFALTLTFLPFGTSFHGVGFMTASGLSLLLTLHYLGRAITRLPMRMFSGT